MFVGQEEKHLEADANGEVVKDALRNDGRSQLFVQRLERDVYVERAGGETLARVERVVGSSSIEVRYVLLLISQGVEIIISSKRGSSKSQQRNDRGYLVIVGAD